MFKTNILILNTFQLKVIKSNVKKKLSKNKIAMGFLKYCDYIIIQVLNITYYFNSTFY